MKREVMVIGAGIMGLTLASELAKRGIDVTIHDSKSSVSQGAAKASGIFSKEGLSRMAINFDGALLNTLNGAVIHGGGETFRVDTGGTKALVLDRGIMAELCAKDAERNGAKIVLGNRLQREEMVELSKDDNKIIVGADGAVSTVASAFGFPEIRERILTYKAEFEDVSIEDRHKVELFFSTEISKRFFGWTVPYSNSKLEVGIGISNIYKTSAAAVFESFMELQAIREMLAGARKTAGYASIIPLCARKRTVSGNVMLVGDAAGQVKATTGGGIIFGTGCARIAATTIIENIKNGKSLQRYESEWRKQYELDLRLHKIVHGLYSRLKPHEMRLAMKTARMLGAEKFLSKYGDMDSPSLMLKRFFLRTLAN